MQSLDFSRLAAALCVVWALVLGLAFGHDHGFLIGAHGKPLANEYVGVRAAGELALAGRPAAAYDWTEHSARHDAITGANAADGYYPWGYPPIYLFVAAALALLPYTLSALIWIAGSLALQMASSAAIVRDRRAALFAAAAPPAFVNASIAHTGFLVAGLLSFALERLVPAPLTSGVLFGLMAFKPQFGLLVPVALVAGRHWRTIGAAAVTVAALAALSVVVFGIAPWDAFPAQLARITDIFRFARTDTTKLVSLYGVARTMGLSHAPALGAQAVLTTAAAGWIWRLWRSDRSQPLKSAGLVVASLAASPYLYIYDLTVLVPALLFLYVAIGRDGFDKLETAAILIAAAFSFNAEIGPIPAGLVALVIVATLVVRRTRSASRSTAQANSTATTAPQLA